MPLVCQDRARALAALGHEVHVLTTGLPGHEGVLNDEGVHVHHLPVPPQVYSAPFADACRRAVGRLTPDAVHLDSFDRDRPWWTDLGRPRPLVAITMHGLAFGGFLSAWNRFLDGGGAPRFPAEALAGEAHALARADVVVAVSDHEAWVMRDLYNLEAVVVVPNPIAPVFFERSDRSAPRTGFVCVGSPSTSGNRRFDLATQAARRAGVALDVLTRAPRATVAERLRRAQALVLPTFWEQGFDLTVAEALASGCPVITTFTGSYGRFSECCPYLRTVRRGSVDALASAMTEALPVVPAGAADDFRPEVHAANWLGSLAAGRGRGVTQ